MCIVETISTCDVTFEKSGITNIRTPKDSIEVVACNGKNDNPEIIGIITTTNCDENGNTEFRLKMNEVS